MAIENTEATLPGTGASEDRDGKAAWTDASNITAVSNRARCQVGASTYSDWLRASNFGFHIPTGSEINGIVVEIFHIGVGITDSALYLVGADGNNIGDNKASGTDWGFAADTASYGSSSDVWGAALKPYKINNSDFGVRLSAANASPSPTVGYAYWVKITVYYTPIVTDYKTPIHCVSATRSGSAIAWTNYSRAEESDNYYAEASVPTSSYTDWLRVDEFQFDADDLYHTNVVGVNVKIERKAGITANLYDSSLYLRTSSGQISSDGALATKWTTTDTEVVYYWDLVGLGLIGDDVTDDDFGVELSVACDSDAETVAYVDCISVRIFYVSGEASQLPETIQDHCNTGDSAGMPIFGNRWRAQTFTPSSSYKITSVKLRLYRSGNPGTINVEIYATSGGYPTGDALCSGTTDGNTLATGSPYEWRQITLGAGYQLSTGIKYAIVVKALSGNSGNSLWWRYRGTSGYEGGNIIISFNSGGAWSDYANYDSMFEVWGQVGTTTGFLLMETDDFLLLETGDKILLETIGGAAYFRIITLNLSLSPSISRVATHPRSITTNLSLSPSITRTKGFIRTLTSNLTLATTITRVVAWKRAITSQLNLSTTVSRVVTWTRATTSNLTLNPVIIVRRVVDYFITIVTNLSLNPIISRQWGVKRAITTNLSLSPSVSRVVAWARTTSSNITLSPTITRSRGIVRSITTNLSLAVSVVRTATYTRVTSSNLTLLPVIVITAIAKFLKVLVAAGNVYIAKTAEGNVYKMKTAVGNAYLLKTVVGAIYGIKSIAGRIYHIIIKEVQ